MDSTSPSGTAGDHETPTKLAVTKSDDEMLEAGGNFMWDFEKALTGNFDFKGKCAYASLLPNAPNPGVCIDGVGVLGLPLSEHDARRMIAASEQAPYGQGAETLVNKEVRDTWTLGADKIQLANPLWEPFMNSVAQMVCTHLGVAPSTPPPRVELYKLLLYETGSHFLAHQDHEKTKGMFATIIIILPSKYTGGQVHVSHGQFNDMFDFADQSMFGTALLSWYTDVTHEVKTVESGYRLALSYNLIHTAPNVSPPGIPKSSVATAELRRVLKKWMNKLYEDPPNKVCYLLKHQYSEVGLRGSALKGSDANLVSYLRPICEDLGFKLYLASLECHMTGPAADDGDYGGGGYYGKRRKYPDNDDSDSVESATGSMLEVDEIEISVENLVDLAGDPPKSVELEKFAFEREYLIPEDPFTGKRPDDRDHSGYTGNEGSTLEYWYRRTVIILWHESWELDLAIEIGGIDAALQRLSSPSQTPSDEEKRIAKYLSEDVSASSADGRKSARVVANAAATWKDLDLWLLIAKSSSAGRDVDILGIDQLARALEAFPFSKLEKLYEDIIRNTPDFTSRVKLVQKLSTAIPDDSTIQQWCQLQMTGILENVKLLAVKDIPFLIEEAEKREASCLQEIIMPQLKKLGMDKSFWVQIAKALRSRVEVLDKPHSTPHSWDDARPIIHGIVNDALQDVLDRTDANELLNTHYNFASHLDEGGITHTLDILELCVSMGYFDACRMIFQKLLDPLPPHAELERRFVDFFTPFAPKLKALLEKYGLRADAPPFKAFFKTLVTIYSDRLVGKQPKGPAMQWVPRKVGCGCGDCVELDKFTQSTDQRSAEFRVATHRRDHLIRQIEASNRQDGATYTTQVIRSGSPHRLVVTRNVGHTLRRMWTTKQAKLEAFKKSIGDEALLATIMSDTPGEPLSTPAPHTLTAAGSSSQVHPEPAASASDPQGQGKRKRSDVVIDLTGD